MRVAYDWGPLLDPPTGVGRYARELASALEALGVEIARYAVSYGAAGDGPKGPSVARWRLPARVVQAAWRRTGRPSIRRLVGTADVVHATNFVLPPLDGTAGVVTVHDLSFLRDDIWPGGRRLRDLVPWSVRRASAVLVPSGAIAEELQEWLRVPTGRIVVTPEGVSPVFYSAAPLSEAALGRLGIPGPFVVAVSTLAPRKNLENLLKAWNRAVEAMGTWTLVLAGPPGWGPKLPETKGVIPIGWVGDETLPGLIAAAELFCYPSLYEGFGLPPLEAMAAGTPALVGRYPAAEEVLGDAALLVDPLDPDALAEGLVALLSDPALRARYARAGRAHSLRYTWHRTAAATLKAYEAARA